MAELDGDVVGYLEARLEEPLDSAGYQTNRSWPSGACSSTRSSLRARTGAAASARRSSSAAETWGRERGATVAVMDTYAESPVSVPFWEGRGYRTRAVIMRKRLD